MQSTSAPTLADLASLHKVNSELTLVDLVMPGMGGIELMQAAHQHNPDIGCLFLTSISSLASAVEARVDRNPASPSL